MKDIKLVFRCLSYLHFHYLVNTSKSQVCAKSWAWQWPSQDQHGPFGRGPSGAKAWPQESASIWGKRWVTCDLEPGGITQHRLRNNVRK